MHFDVLFGQGRLSEVGVDTVEKYMDEYILKFTGFQS